LWFRQYVCLGSAMIIIGIRLLYGSSAVKKVVEFLDLSSESGTHGRSLVGFHSQL
jgi:hypothetical protein